MADKAKLMEMLTSLMNDDGGKAETALHEYMSEKTREMLDEKCGMRSEEEEKKASKDMKKDKKEEMKGKEKDMSESLSFDDDILIEKWSKEHKVAPSERGKYKDKTLAELKKMLKSANTKEKRGEIAFAIRAKQKDKWGKIKESADLLAELDTDLLDEIYTIVMERKPSTGMTKKEKSAVVKKARAGKDIGEKGKNFEKIEKKAAKRYGSEEAGKRVAGAALWKKEAKK